MEHTKGKATFTDSDEEIIIVGGKSRNYIASVQIRQCGGGAIAAAMEDGRKANARRLVACWNAHDMLVGELKGVLKSMDCDAIQCNGDWQTGMFCGLEDRNITDIYDACMYGYEMALKRVREWVLDGLEEAIAEAEKGK